MVSLPSFCAANGGRRMTPGQTRTFIMDYILLLCFASMLVVKGAANEALDCSSMTCPTGTVLIEGSSAVPCPPDSIRPLVSHLFNGEPTIGADECCLTPCQCKTPCPPAKTCPENRLPLVIKHGTGKPGSCCPVYECSSSNGTCTNERTGEPMFSGEEWKEDPCTTCRCDDGLRRCQVYMCTCSSPRNDPEGCCPVCDSASEVTVPPHCQNQANCSLRCRQGWVKDKDGCFLCQCQTEECNLDCPHGFLEDISGKKKCECAKCPVLNCKKNCTHGLRTNRNGCPTCKCNKCKQLVFALDSDIDVGLEGKIIDWKNWTRHEVMLLCPKTCPFGYRKDDRGCPTCHCIDPPHIPEEITTHYSEDVETVISACISSEGKEMGEHDVWWIGCKKCHCFQGLESCSVLGCPPEKDLHNTQIHQEPSAWQIGVIVLGILLALAIFVIFIMIWRLIPWKQRSLLSCSHTNVDGSDVRLEVSPSPSPTCSPTQKNGNSKVPRYRKDRLDEVEAQKPLYNGSISIH